eukprot:13963634-Alexandrium_andersonii.AAC.1
MAMGHSMCGLVHGDRLCAMGHVSATSAQGGPHTLCARLTARSARGANRTRYWGGRREGETWGGRTGLRSE